MTAVLIENLRIEIVTVLLLNGWYGSRFQNSISFKFDSSVRWLLEHMLTVVSDLAKLALTFFPLDFFLFGSKRAERLNEKK